MAERITEGNILIPAQLSLTFFHILECLEKHCMVLLIDNK